MNIKDTDGDKTGNKASNPHITLTYAMGIMCLITLLYLVSESSKHSYPESAYTPNHHESLESTGKVSLDIMMFKHMFQYANGRKRGGKIVSQFSNHMSMEIEKGTKGEQANARTLSLRRGDGFGNRNPF